ncbi:MAG TPA: DUF2017 family protein [Ilumatobacter sp.]|nr:DUF2017 family protein [Ilumatobacter sp.]
MIRFRAPIRRDGDGFVVALSPDEAELVQRLLGELGELLASDAPSPLTERLFPVVHPDDPEQEAEYQRWMRPELVQSKLTAIATVDAALTGDGRLDEGGLLAFMQGVNSVRLVLGAMLDITDEEQPDEDDDEAPYEMQLYVYLSWLLEWSVRAMTNQ